VPGSPASPSYPANDQPAHSGRETSRAPWDTNDGDHQLATEGRAWFADQHSVGRMNAGRRPSQAYEPLDVRVTAANPKRTVTAGRYTPVSTHESTTQLTDTTCLNAVRYQPQSRLTR
jgi:hypothetical protein